MTHVPMMLFSRSLHDKSGTYRYCGVANHQNAHEGQIYNQVGWRFRVLFQQNFRRKEINFWK
jgi:hypothetical protein